MAIKKGDLVLLMGQRNYLVKAQDKFSTQFGEINLDKLVRRKYGTKIKSHMGKEFIVVQPRTCDLLKKIKRMPQIVMPKDAGMIAGITGLTKRDKVVDAGTGSGALTIFLAGIVEKVYTYERRPEFASIARENFKKCGLTNVVLREKDIEKGIQEKEVDVITLDMGSPEKAIKHAHKALKPGGFVVVYSPVVEQILKVQNAMKGFSEVKTIECIKRDWEVGNNKTRPRTRMIGHTAFLTFGRKI